MATPFLVNSMIFFYLRKSQISGLIKPGFVEVSLWRIIKFNVDFRFPTKYV